MLFGAPGGNVHKTNCDKRLYAAVCSYMYRVAYTASCRRPTPFDKTRLPCATIVSSLTIEFSVGVKVKYFYYFTVT